LQNTELLNKSYAYRLPYAEMFSELRFAIPAKISTRLLRKTSEYQRILKRSSRICIIIFKTLYKKM